MAKNKKYLFDRRKDDERQRIMKTVTVDALPHCNYPVRIRKGVK